MTKTVRRRVIAAVTVLAAGGAALFAVTGNGQAGEVHRAHWVGTWAAAPVPASPTNTGGSLTGFSNESIRMIVHTSVAGNRLRIRLSNEFGNQAIAIGHATVALPAAPATPDLAPGSVHELTFNGSASTTAYKGADLLSDPVAMDVPALAELVVTVFLPTATGPVSWHPGARETTYIYTGDQADNLSGAAPEKTRFAFFFLTGVDVVSRHTDGSVAVVGDSLSNGDGSTLNANTRWPDFLAARLDAPHTPAHDLGVLNGSISGNELTHDGGDLAAFPFGPIFGASGLARLDRDALAQTGVRSLIVELGVNDLNLSGDAADRIIAGLKQFAAQAHEHDLRVLVCTIGPFEGFAGPPGWDTTKEAVRVAVNTYIRGQYDFDGVVDLDAALRDPAAPTKLRADLDSGDHIHPNDAGAQVLAGAVPLDRL